MQKRYLLLLCCLRPAHRRSVIQFADVRDAALLHAWPVPDSSFWTSPAGVPTQRQDAGRSPLVRFAQPMQQQDAGGGIACFKGRRPQPAAALYSASMRATPPTCISGGLSTNRRLLVWSDFAKVTQAPAFFYHGSLSTVVLCIPVFCACWLPHPLFRHSETWLGTFKSLVDALPFVRNA